jgi:hypothetical protein
MAESREESSRYEQPEVGCNTSMGVDASPEDLQRAREDVEEKIRKLEASKEDADKGELEVWRAWMELYKTL